MLDIKEAETVQSVNRLPIPTVQLVNNLTIPTLVILRVRPANFQRMPIVRWKLHGSNLAENRTVGSPWLVFHENGPYSVIWAFKKPKK